LSGLSGTDPYRLGSFDPLFGGRGYRYNGRNWTFLCGGLNFCGWRRRGSTHSPEQLFCSLAQEMCKPGLRHRIIRVDPQYPLQAILLLGGVGQNKTHKKPALFRRRILHEVLCEDFLCLIQTALYDQLGGRSQGIGRGREGFGHGFIGRSFSFLSMA
jgi:hypothetical protein